MVNGRVHDENRLKKVIYDRIKSLCDQWDCKESRKSVGCHADGVLHRKAVPVSRPHPCGERHLLSERHIPVPQRFLPEPSARFLQSRSSAASDMAAFFVSAFGARGHSDFTGIYGILLYSPPKGQKMLLLIGKRWRGAKPHWYCPSVRCLGSNMNTGSIAKVETSPSLVPIWSMSL